jgi:serine/threonine protein phosphatase PrpC
MAAKVTIRVGSATLQGRRRRNEDAVRVIVGARSAILAVADGLGGHEHGDRAAKAAIAELPAALKRRPTWPGVFDDLDGAVWRAGGSTTLTAVRIDLVAGRYELAWCGDSPGMRIRGQDAEVLEPHGYGHIVTRCLGGNAGVLPTPDVLSGDVLPGDVFLLASDGLDVLLDDGADAKTLGHLLTAVRCLPPRPRSIRRSGEARLNRMARGLAELAIERGSDDNVTVAIGVVEAT